VLEIGGVTVHVVAVSIKGVKVHEIGENQAAFLACHLFFDAVHALLVAGCWQ
jgi:hypothetical protein